MSIPTVPKQAVPAWLRLQYAIAESQVPCAERPEWTSEDPEERQAAAFQCAGCSVLGLCDEYAATAKEKANVWAGRDRTIKPRKANA